MWNSNIAIHINRIILGLTMSVAGFLKLFVFKPAGVVGMLTSLSFPAPSFFAWVLILSEIIFGLAVLFNLKVEYTAFPLAIILIIAGLTFWGEWSGLLLHFAAASNLWFLAAKDHEHRHKK